MKGLLVLFDESEALYATRGYQAMERSVNFIDTLIVTARDDPEMLQPAWQTNYTHSRNAADVPFLYRQPSGLKLLFAFAANDQLNVSTKLASQAFLDLLPLDAGALGTILTQVQTLYQRAYDAKGNDGIDLDVWGKILAERSFDTTRAMVKSAVEALDIARFGTYVPEEDD